MLKFAISGGGTSFFLLSFQGADLADYLLNSVIHTGQIDHGADSLVLDELVLVVPDPHQLRGCLLVSDEEVRLEIGDIRLGLQKAADVFLVEFRFD